MLKAVEAVNTEIRDLLIANFDAEDQRDDDVRTDAVVVLAVPTPAGWVEALYSQQLYLIAQNIVTPLSSMTRVAVFDLLLAATVLGVCGSWLAVLWRSRS